jgi:DNA-binding HxlR family transcriptional regulator
MEPKKTRRNAKKTVGCPVETTLSVIGGQWKVMVLHFLMEQPMRFGELNRALRGISARTLTKQLRELERDGIIHREVHQQIPPKVEYSLTPIGTRLKPVLLAMHRWGEELEHHPPAPPRKPAK